MDKAVCVLLHANIFQKGTNPNILPVGEVGINSSVIFSWALQHMDTPVLTYINQCYEDTRCHVEDLPRAMADRLKWQESWQNLYCEHFVMINAHNSILQWISIFLLILVEEWKVASNTFYSLLSIQSFWPSNFTLLEKDETRFVWE